MYSNLLQDKLLRKGRSMCIEFESMMVRILHICVCVLRIPTSSPKQKNARVLCLLKCKYNYCSVCICM